MAQPTSAILQRSLVAQSGNSQLLAFSGDWRELGILAVRSAALHAAFRRLVIGFGVVGRRDAAKHYAAVSFSTGVARVMRVGLGKVLELTSQRAQASQAKRKKKNSSKPVSPEILKSNAVSKLLYNRSRRRRSAGFLILGTMRKRISAKKLRRFRRRGEPKHFRRFSRAVLARITAYRLFILRSQTRMGKIARGQKATMPRVQHLAISRVLGERSNASLAIYQAHLNVF